FGLWFSGDFALWENIQATLAYNDGVFVRWILNTLLYVVVGAGGATFLAVIGGYALAKFNFPGKRGVFAVVLGAIAGAGTALAVSASLLVRHSGLADTTLPVITPQPLS